MIDGPSSKSFVLHPRQRVSCLHFIAFHLSISPRLAIFTVIVASVYLFQQSTSDSMASSASTRNLTTNGPMDGRTDSVLNIGLETLAVHQRHTVAGRGLRHRLSPHRSETNS